MVIPQQQSLGNRRGYNKTLVRVCFTRGVPLQHNVNNGLEIIIDHADNRTHTNTPTETTRINMGRSATNVGTGGIDALESSSKLNKSWGECR